jgi:hypothetical protein
LGIALVALMLGAAVARGQAANGDQLTVSLITVGPGPEFFSWFGHSALVITDARTGRERLYDYGVFFRSALTAGNLLRGTITASAGEWDAPLQERAWRAAGRTVSVQRLALTPPQRLDLQHRLTMIPLAADRTYRYNFQTDNCTTRIRDLLDRVTGGALRRAGIGSTATTVRAIGYPYLTSYWVLAGFDLLNNQVEHASTQWEAALYPEQLASLVARTTLGDGSGEAHPLAARFASPVMTRQSALTGTRFLQLGLGLGAISLLAGMLARGGSSAGRLLLGAWIALAGGTVGVAGAVLGAGWLFTAYPFVRHNANLLLVNPLLLVAIPLGIGYATGSARAARMFRPLANILMLLVIAWLTVNALVPLHQDSQYILRLILPALLGLAGGLYAPSLWLVRVASGPRPRLRITAVSIPTEI